jgi:hypothetical protein
MSKKTNSIHFIHAAIAFVVILTIIIAARAPETLSWLNAESNGGVTPGGFIGGTSPNIGIGTTAPNERLSIGDGTLFQGGQLPLNRVSTATLIGLSRVTAIDIEGRYAFIGREGTGDRISVIEFSDPTNPDTFAPTIINAGAPWPTVAINHLKVSGKYMYVVFDTPIKSDMFRIVDISNPDELQVVGGSNLGIIPQIPTERPERVEIMGKYVYLIFSTSNNSDKLRILNVVDPSAPSYVGGQVMPQEIEGIPTNIIIRGKYAYLTTHSSFVSDFSVVDISDPSNPSVIGSVEWSSQPVINLYVRGQYAYTLTSTSGNPTLKVIDISNPASPSLISVTITTDAIAYGHDITGMGRYMVLALTDSITNDPLIRIMDVFNSEDAIVAVGGQNYTPSILTNINQSPKIAVSGNYMLLGGESNGVAPTKVEIIDLTGIESTSVLAHTADTENIQVRTNAVVHDNFTVGGGFNVTSSTMFNASTTIEGDINVEGTIEANDKTFIIDHPIDPKNKILRHSNVESNQIMNFYDGIKRLDEEGRATIKLPEYMEALNKDFTIQFTALEKPQPSLYIEKWVKDNKFTIAGGAPYGRVSWQITGIRHDPYAETHPLIVEEEKQSLQY